VISTIGNICATATDEDRLVCHTPAAVHTRGDWRRDVDTLVAFLGDRHELRWGLYAANTYDFSVGLFALWCSGKTPVIPPLNTPGVVQALAPHVDGLLGEFPSAEPILRNNSNTQPENVAGSIRPDAQLVMFTSGSSGEPKAIWKNFGQLDAEIATLELLWGTRIGQAIALATVSHQHIYGLLFKVLWPLAANRPFYTNIVRDPQTLVALSARHRGAVWVTSPAFLKRIPMTVLQSNADAEVTLFSSGGLLVAPIAHRIARQMGEPPIEVYGSTETGGIAYRQQRPPNRDTPWVPLPRVEIDANIEGQLLVRSPHLPDDDWYLTGDRGTLLAGHRFCLGSRIDRIVKVEEKRVSLTAMETELAAVAGVTDAVCILRPGRRDTICAVLALDAAGYRELYSGGRRTYIRRLRDVLLAQFDRITLPRKWRFVEELPVNDQGKVSAGNLLALFEPTRVHRMPVVTGISCPTEYDTTLTLFIPRHLTYFDGHFAGTPVLPGVAQLFWAGHFARQVFGLDFVWPRMEAVKFNRLVLPETTVTLHLVRREDHGRLQFSYAVDGVTCSSGRLIQRE
jgi:hypothetical protein